MTGAGGGPMVVAGATGRQEGSGATGRQEGSGATGRQEGSAVGHLLARQLTVRALVLDPRRDRARALAGQGIQIAHGDMDDLASLHKAVAGAYGAYSVQDYFTAGASREVRQGKNMADAAPDAGVEHFVFPSVGGAERKSGIPHFEPRRRSRSTSGNWGCRPGPVVSVPQVHRPAAPPSVRPTTSDSRQHSPSTRLSCPATTGTSSGRTPVIASPRRSRPCAARPDKETR